MSLINALIASNLCSSRASRSSSSAFMSILYLKKLSIAKKMASVAREEDTCKYTTSVPVKTKVHDKSGAEHIMTYLALVDKDC